MVAAVGKPATATYGESAAADGNPPPPPIGSPLPPLQSDLAEGRVTPPVGSSLPAAGALHVHSHRIWRRRGCRRHLHWAAATRERGGRETRDARRGLGGVGDKDAVDRLTGSLASMARGSAATQGLLLALCCAAAIIAVVHGEDWTVGDKKEWTFGIASIKIRPNIHHRNQAMVRGSGTGDGKGAMPKTRLCLLLRPNTLRVTKKEMNTRIDNTNNVQQNQIVRKMGPMGPQRKRLREHDGKGLGSCEGRRWHGRVRRDGGEGVALMDGGVEGGGGVDGAAGRSDIQGWRRRGHWQGGWGKAAEWIGLRRERADACDPLPFSASPLALLCAAHDFRLDDRLRSWTPLFSALNHRTPGRPHPSRHGSPSPVQCHPAMLCYLRSIASSTSAASPVSTRHDLLRLKLHRRPTQTSFSVVGPPLPRLKLYRRATVAPPTSYMNQPKSEKLLGDLDGIFSKKLKPKKNDDIQCHRLTSPFVLVGFAFEAFTSPCFSGMCSSSAPPMTWQPVPPRIRVFKYDVKIHNVVEVDRAGYDRCTVTGPSNVYNSGDDRIKLAETTLARW
uniref:Phytocyanin domain-containing protein n=1 Tax=Oryza punctata TaxID=4537 RepID=A0A0E0JY33_ORYPU